MIQLRKTRCSAELCVKWWNERQKRTNLLKKLGFKRAADRLRTPVISAYGPMARIGDGGREMESALEGDGRSQHVHLK
jgi:hypothetical protein